MESKFRPIPVTISDFLAILLPGFVWFILLTVTVQELIYGSSPLLDSPTEILKQTALGKDPETSGLSLLLLVVVISLLIGFILKPLSMRVAGRLSSFRLKTKKQYRHIPLKVLKYPFNAIFEDAEYYRKVCDFIALHTECEAQQLPGNQPFSVGKRYLKLAAPTLWEECERMEAEVRMTGVLFLASVYSILVSGILLIRSFAQGRFPVADNTLVWFVLSVIAATILCESFNYMRIREVSYTYLNVLLASKFKSLPTTAEKPEDE